MHVPYRIPFRQGIIAACIVMLASATLAVDSPRERLLMDFNWRFHLGDAPDAGTNFDYPEVSDLAKTKLEEIGQGTNLIAKLPEPFKSNLGAGVSYAKPRFDDSSWRSLDLPHDWAVEMPFDTNADFKHGFKPVGPNFPQNNIGWYRREFTLPGSDRGRRLWVEFDGVYRDSLVWLNGHCLGRNPSGYGSFRYDITKFVNYGVPNDLVVRVDASRFEGWFYEGAGIYRHVWLVKTSPLYFAPDGVFVWGTFSNNVPGDIATVHVQAQLVNYQSNSVDLTVRSEIFSPDGKFLVRFRQATNMEDYSKMKMDLTTLIEPPRVPGAGRCLCGANGFSTAFGGARPDLMVAGISETLQARHHD